jgi:hypothetical protein
MLAATPTIPSNLPAEDVTPTPEMNSRLSPDDQALLAQARARGDRDVVLLVATAPGRSSEVAALIESMGGVIRSHHENLDYLSASVPLDMVEDVARLDGVVAVNLDRDIPAPKPRPTG